MWREITHRIAEEYPDVELIDMLVDNAAMQLINDPKQFDVVVTENMFGDILRSAMARRSMSRAMAVRPISRARVSLTRSRRFFRSR